MILKMAENNVLNNLYISVQVLTEQLLSVTNIVQNLQAQVNNMNSQLSTSLQTAIHTPLPMEEEETLQNSITENQAALMNLENATNLKNSMNSTAPIIIVMSSSKLEKYSDSLMYNSD